MFKPIYLQVCNIVKTIYQKSRLYKNVKLYNNDSKHFDSYIFKLRNK